MAKKDSIKIVLDDVKKRIDEMVSNEQNVVLEENFVLSTSTPEQQDTINHHPVHLDMNADIIDDVVTDNSGVESELSEIDQIVAFMMAPDENENTLNDNSIPEVEKDEDGRIWLYLRDHKIDITKQIEKQGYAQEKIKDGLLADYITVVWDEDGGYSLGTDYHKFPDVEELRENTK